MSSPLHSKRGKSRGSWMRSIKCEHVWPSKNSCTRSVLACLLTNWLVTLLTLMYYHRRRMQTWPRCVLLLFDWSLWCKELFSLASITSFVNWLVVDWSIPISLCTHACMYSSPHLTSPHLTSRVCRISSALLSNTRNYRRKHITSTASTPSDTSKCGCWMRRLPST